MLLIHNFDSCSLYFIAIQRLFHCFARLFELDGRPANCFWYRFGHWKWAGSDSNGKFIFDYCNIEHISRKACHRLAIPRKARFSIDWLIDWLIGFWNLLSKSAYNEKTVEHNEEKAHWYLKCTNREVILN